MATMRVLVADQEPDMLEAVARAFEVDVATSKATCIDLLRANQFDVIVACERLSDGSGLELLSHVGQRWPKVIRILAIEPQRRAMLRGRLGPFKLFETLSYPIDEAKLEAALGRAAEQIAANEAAEPPDAPTLTQRVDWGDAPASPGGRPRQSARPVQPSWTPPVAEAAPTVQPSAAAKPSQPTTSARPFQSAPTATPSPSAVSARPSQPGPSATPSQSAPSARPAQPPSGPRPSPLGAVSRDAARSTSTPFEAARSPGARTVDTPSALNRRNGSPPSSPTSPGGASFAGKSKPDTGYPPLPSKGSKIVPLGSPAAPDYKILPHNYQEPMPGTLRSARDELKKPTLQEKAAALAAEALSAVSKYIKPQTSEEPPPERPSPKAPPGRKR
jgi:ActR/RegA family two-component response regulator